MTNKLGLLPQGKGVYIWQPGNILGGSIERIVNALDQANIDFVAIKAHDGVEMYETLDPLIQAIRNSGIVVGIWGYVYVKWWPEDEAFVIEQAIRRHLPSFYLLDIEAHAKNQPIKTQQFSDSLRKMDLRGVPVGLNSYYRPDLHMEIAWNSLFEISDFLCPQCYYRNYDPVGKLKRSISEYKKLTTLSMPMVAGDIYYEYGLKPTPEQVQQFLEYADQHPAISSVLFWSMDQIEKTPELWDVLANYHFGGDVPVAVEEPKPTFDDFVKGVVSHIQSASRQFQEHANYYYEFFENRTQFPICNDSDRMIWNAMAPLIGEEQKPIHSAQVKALWGLRIRGDRSTKNSPIGLLSYGSLVHVWEEALGEGRVWARISKDQEKWVAAEYLKKL